MPEIKEILEDLKSETIFDSTGNFTLDKRKAREKMKNFQLIDPHYYVLELVQAAVASEATYIDIYLDEENCVIAFDGQHYLKKDLDNIYSSLFVSQKDTSLERYRELAIGLNSAMALNPRYIKVSSGDGSEGTVLKISPPDQEEILEPEEMFRGTKIHVKDRISWEWAKKIFNKYIIMSLPTEGKILKEKCIYCPIPIKINGELINEDEKKNTTYPESIFCTYKFKSDDISAEMSVSEMPYNLSHLQFVKWGVIVANRNLRFSFLHVNGTVWCNSLTKNVSQSDIVENQIYRNVLEKIKSQSENVIYEMAEKYTKIDPDNYVQWVKVRKYLLNFIESRFRITNYKENDTPQMQTLLNINILETSQGTFTSLETLINQYEQTGFVPYVRKYFYDPHPEELTVLYAGDEDKINLYTKIFSGRLRNSETDFIRISEREENVKKWQETKTENLVLFSDAMVKIDFEADGINGTLGLAPCNPDAYTVISLNKEKGKICKKTLDIGSLFFEGVVNNDKLNPNFLWDDLKIDWEFTKTLQTAILYTPMLYEKLAEKFPAITSGDATDPEAQDIARLHLISYITFICDKSKGDKIVQILESPQDVFKASATKQGKIVKITPPTTELSHIFKTIKIFKTITNEYLSLEDLEKDVEKFRFISWVGREFNAPSTEERNVLFLSHDMETAALKNYFGKDILKNYEKTIQDEINTLKYMQRPFEKPEIAESTLEKVTFDKRGIQGEIGLLTYEDPLTGAYSFKTQDGRMIPTANIRTKILKKNRFINILPMAYPLSGIYAVINYDDINVDETWHKVIEDEKLEKIKARLEREIKNLASAIAKNYPNTAAHEAKTKMRRFLIQYACYYIGRIDFHNKDNFKDKTAQLLLNLPLFFSMEGGEITLENLRENQAKFGKIAYVFQPVSDVKIEDRIILMLSMQEADIIQQIFGQDNLENVEEMLKAQKIMEIIKKSKPMEKPIISEFSVLFKLPFDSGGITGEIGPVRQGRGSGESLSSVRIMKENRFVTTKLERLPIQCEAAVNYDDLNVDTNWAQVTEDDKLQKVRNLLAEQQQNLAKEILNSYEKFNEKEISTVHQHILSYLTNTFSHYRDLSNLESTGGQLAQLEIFQALGRENRVSLLQLINEYEKNGKINYVYYWTDQKPMDPKTLVAVLDSPIITLLKMYFVRFSDYTANLAQEKIAAANMTKNKLQDLTIQDNYSVKIEVKKDDMEGELALPHQLPLRRTITFAKNMIPIVDKLLYSRSNVFGSINCDGFETNATFNDVILSERQKEILSQYIGKLYKKLARQYQKCEDPSLLEVHRQLLLDFYYEQKNYFISESHSMDKDLKHLIESLNLIPIWDGRFTNISVLIKEIERNGYLTYIYNNENLYAPTEDVVLKLSHYGFDYEFCRKFVGLDRIKHQKDILESAKIKEDLEKLKAAQEKTALKNQEKIEQSQAEDEKRRQELAKNIAEQKKQSEVKQKSKKDAEENIKKDSETQDYSPQEIENFTKELKLLYAIKKEFRIVRERGDYKLSEKVLKNMEIGSKKDAPAVIFNQSQESLLINKSNPVVEYLVNSIEGEPHLIYYLLSIIYSTINRELKKITDEDEMQFQNIMLQNLVSARCADGRQTSEKI